VPFLELFLNIFRTFTAYESVKMIHFCKKKRMQFFRYPIPKDIKVLLRVLDIHSEKDLIDYFEIEIQKYSRIDFGWMLFKNPKMKKLFYFYQSHTNNEEIPFLMNFAPIVQKSFLLSGVFDVKQLKEFAMTDLIVSLIGSNSKYNEFVRAIVREEEGALDNFYDHFSTRVRCRLRYFEVENFYDLRNFMRETNLDVSGLGVKGKQEILAVWEREMMMR
jgi:hypothetical protein